MADALKRVDIRFVEQKLGVDLIRQALSRTNCWISTDMIPPVNRMWSAPLVAWREHEVVESVRSGLHGAAP